MRQHVNPLSSFFQLPVKLPLPEELFLNADLPIHLDIGSARGQFLLDYAEIQRNWNFLGVEIRQSLVASANNDVEHKNLKNVRFLFCNANVSLQSWLDELPFGLLQRVSIQFPDPWFKRRHHKRRVLQPSLLTSLAKSMKPGSELFLQSDCLSVIQPMTELIEKSFCFDPHTVNNYNWLAENPCLIKSEREIYAINKGLLIYRILYKRNNNQSNLKLLELS